MNSLVLQGGGGHARVVADCLLSDGSDIKGYFALDESGLFNLPYLGKEAGPVAESGVIIAIGDNHIRMKLAASWPRLRYAMAIHSSATVSAHASIGAGTMILHGSIVQAGTRIGSHVILNTGCQVDHDCRLGDFVHIGPRAVLCGNVFIGEGALIGAGSTIIPGIRVGQWAVIGAGAVVIRDVPDKAVVYGNPAAPAKRSEG